MQQRITRIDERMRCYSDAHFRQLPCAHLTLTCQLHRSVLVGKGSGGDEQERENRNDTKDQEKNGTVRVLVLEP